MNYELAKQLKDSGFPQNDTDLVLVEDDRHLMDIHTANEMGYGYAYAPTLSELIEACGEYFVLLYRSTNQEYLWESEGNKDKENHNYGRGSTSEEAVANLWLELNKRP